MGDFRVENLARTLVNYSVKVAEDDLVLIGCRPYHPRAYPFLQAIYREVLRAGGHPHLEISIEGLDYVFYTEANEKQLSHVDPRAKMVVSDFDCAIYFSCVENTQRFAQVDPEVRSARARAVQELYEIRNQRMAAGEHRAVGTIYPSSGFAQDAEMSLEEFEDFYFKITAADQDDPVRYWEEMGDKQAKLVAWLAGKKTIEIKAPNADLTFSIAGRPFINCCGAANMPDGEIFTGPVEDSAQGWIHFTYPAIVGGVEVSGIELTFEQGKVVEATAEKNEAYLMTMLDTDEGAMYIGEFAFGTNQRIDRFTKNILFDEKIGGTIHLALGAGYPESGSLNKSAIHWDMICDMRQGGQAYVDGTLFYDSGEFKI